MCGDVCLNWAERTRIMCINPYWGFSRSQPVATEEWHLKEAAEVPAVPDPKEEVAPATEETDE